MSRTERYPWNSSQWGDARAVCIAFLVLVVTASSGCVRPRPPEHPAAAPPNAVPSPEEPPIPAFVAYSSEATHVFPLHPLADDLAATSTPGIWLLGESEVILFPIIAAHGELPPGGSCPCGSRTTGSCIRSDLSGAVVARWAVDDAPATRPRLDLGDVGSCRCFFEWEGDDAVGDAIATDGDARSLGLCPGPSMAPVSVFGGVLYVSGGTNTLECTGFNIYDLVVDRLPLLGEAPSYAWSGDPLCHPETYFPTDLEALREPCPPVPPAATEDDDDWDSEGRCDICPQGADGEVLVSRSGRIYEVGLATVNTGGDVLFLRSVELTPERCPSPADPCGSAEGFPGLDGADAWWVATDGSAALELRAGQVSVRLRGEPEARGAAPMSETIIGVRFHADVRALLARLAGAPQGNELIALVLDALGTEGPGTDLPPTCNAAAECPTGQQCRASQCVPPCEHDEDCPGSGLCDHVCGADRF